MKTAEDLAPFQRDGVRFLIDVVNGYPVPHRILCDDMGLGKTVQTCFAAKCIEAKTILILCPAAIFLKVQWANHLHEWTGISYTDIQIVNSPNEPLVKDVIIVNFEKCLSPVLQEAILKREFDLVVVDESHRLKSEDAQITQIVLGQPDPLIARGTWKWMLTGTFLPNRPAEAYTSLVTLCPDLLGDFTDAYDYRLRYCGVDGQGASNINELKERIKPVILRRELLDVRKEIPPVIEETIVLNGMIVINPTLTLPEVRRETAVQKAPQIAEYLRDINNLEPGDKKVVFFYHTELGKYLEANVPRTKLIYGGTSDRVRAAIMSEFLNGDTLNLILQISAGGTGIDGLQKKSSHYIQAEPCWSPGLEDQSIGRLQRMGQTRPVRVTRLVAPDTVDEYVYSVNSDKRWAIDAIYEGVKQESFTEYNKRKEKKSMLESHLESIASSLKEIVKLMGAQEVQKTATTNGGKGRGKKNDKAEETPSASEASPPSDAPPEAKGANGSGKAADGDGKDASAGAAKTAANGAGSGKDLRNAATQLAMDILNEDSGIENPTGKVKAILAKFEAEKVSTAAEEHLQGIIDEFTALLGGDSVSDVL